MERMEKLEVLLPRILPQVIGCPRSMALDALQMISVDFCKESEIWNVQFQEGVYPLIPTISIALPKNALIERVSALFLDGIRQDDESYSFDAQDVYLRFSPQRAMIALVIAALRPTRTATMLPEDILEEWGDALAFGALAKLKSMSGQNIEWSDAQGATLNYQLYAEESARAKGRMFRKRLSGSPLYVNPME